MQGEWNDGNEGCFPGKGIQFSNVPLFPWKEVLKKKKPKQEIFSSVLKTGLKGAAGSYWEWGGNLWVGGVEAIVIGHPPYPASSQLSLGICKTIFICHIPHQEYIYIWAVKPTPATLKMLDLSLLIAVGQNKRVRQIQNAASGMKCHWPNLSAKPSITFALTNCSAARSNSAFAGRPIKQPSLKWEEILYISNLCKQWTVKTVRRDGASAANETDFKRPYTNFCGLISK